MSQKRSVHSFCLICTLSERRTKPLIPVKVESIFGNIPHLYQIHLDWWFDAFNPLLTEARRTKQLIQVQDLVKVFNGMEEK